MIDTTAPTGGSINYTNTTSNSTTIVVVFSNGTDSGSGLNISTAQIQRKDGTLAGGECSGYSEFATVNTTYSGTYSDTNVTGDKCFMYQYIIADNAGNWVFYTNINYSKVDTTAPTVGTVTLRPSFDISGTVYVSNATNITASLSDTGSGLAGTCNYTVNNGTDDWPEGTYSTNLCTKTNADTSGAATFIINVGAPDNAGNTGYGTEVEVTRDGTAPTGGYVAYVNDTTNATTITVTYLPGTDAVSDLNNSTGMLRRKEGTLGSGQCTGYSSFATIATEIDGTYADTNITDGTCYMYQYRIADNVGNWVTYTNDSYVKVDTSAPTGGFVTYTNASSAAITIAVVYDLGTDTESDLDNSSGVLQRKEGTLADAECSGYSEFATIANEYDGTYSDTNVSSGLCYMYQYMVADLAGNWAIYTSDNYTKADMVAPEVGAVSILPSFDKAGTIYVPNVTNISASLSENLSGLAGTCNYTLDDGVDDWPEGTYTPNLCTASDVDATLASSINVRAPDAASNIGNGTAVAVTVDGDAPTGGDVSYTNDTTNATTITVTYLTGTDAASDLNNSTGILQRKSTTLASAQCNFTGATFATIANEYDGTYIDSDVADGTCYMYQYLIADNVGNWVTYTNDSYVKVDTSAPTGGYVTYTNASTNETSMTVTFATGADTESDLDNSTGAVQRKEGTLLSGACSGYSEFATVNASVDGTYSDDNLTDGYCYMYQYIISDLAGNWAFYTSENYTKVDTAAPTVGTVSLRPSFDNAGTMYVSNTTTIFASLTDTGSGLAGTCNYTLDDGVDDWPEGTYTPNLCTATDVDTTLASSINVMAADLAANLNNGTPVAVTVDGTGPTGGDVSYTNDTTNATTITVTYLTGTDAASDLNNSTGILQRKSTTLASAQCNFTGATFATIANEYDGTYIDSDVADGTCYMYQYLIADNVGNWVTYTNDSYVKVDTSAPTGGYVTYTNASTNETSMTVTFSTGTDTESDLDNSTGVLQRQESALTNGTCSNYSDFGTVNTSVSGTYSETNLTDGYCYMYQYAISDLAGNQVTYNLGNYTKVDTTAPTGGFVTYTNATTNATTITVTYDPGTDTGSNLDNATGAVQRKEGTLASSQCSGYSEFATVANEVDGTYTDTNITDGLCYMYQYTIADAAGNYVLYTNINYTKIDQTAPAGGSVTYTDGYYTVQSVIVNYTVGNDTVSDLNNASGVLQRKNTTLTNGICGAYGAFTTIANEYDGTYNDTAVTTGYCYMYQYTIADNAGNWAAYTSTNVAKVDFTSPVLSFSSPTTTQTSRSFLVSVYANETNLTCKYSFFTATYANMEGSLADLGNNTYMTATTVPSDGTYTAYFACRDLAGNTGTNNTGAFTVSSVAPSIINSAPSGIYTSLTAPTLEVNTSETATCQYSTTAFAWDSGTAMTNVTATRHTASLGALNDSTYSYYVLCQDTEGNVMASTFPITFVVNTAGNFNYTYNLNLGWNSFWLPRIVLQNLSSFNDSNYSTVNVINTKGNLTGSYTYMYFRNGTSCSSQNGSCWLSYDPESVVNDLSVFNDWDNLPYWINMNTTGKRLAYT